MSSFRIQTCAQQLTHGRRFLGGGRGLYEKFTDKKSVYYDGKDSSYCNCEKHES